MPGPRDEDDVDEENRDTDDRLEPQGDEAEPWQVGAKYCTSEGRIGQWTAWLKRRLDRFQFRTEVLIDR